MGLNEDEEDDYISRREGNASQNISRVGTSRPARKSRWHPEVGQTPGPDLRKVQTSIDNKNTDYRSVHRTIEIFHDREFLQSVRDLRSSRTRSQTPNPVTSRPQTTDPQDPEQETESPDPRPRTLSPVTWKKVREGSRRPSTSGTFTLSPPSSPRSVSAFQSSSRQRSSQGSVSRSSSTHDKSPNRRPFDPPFTGIHKTYYHREISAPNIQEDTTVNFGTQGTYNPREQRQKTTYYSSRKGSSELVSESPRNRDRAATDSTLHDYEVLRRRFEEGLQQERKQYEY